MSVKIDAVQLLKKQTLEVNADGIVYIENPGFGMGDTFHYSFDRIDAVIQSAAEPLLSIQIGDLILSLKFNRNDENHRAVIDQIVAGAQKTV